MIADVLHSGGIGVAHVHALKRKVVPRRAVVKHRIRLIVRRRCVGQILAPYAVARDISMGMRPEHGRVPVGSGQNAVDHFLHTVKVLVGIYGRRVVKHVHVDRMIIAQGNGEKRS